MALSTMAVPKRRSFFDSRSLASKRMYLRCLLALPELKGNGVTFASTKQSKYYDLLVRAKGPVEGNLKSKKQKVRRTVVGGG